MPPSRTAFSSRPASSIRDLRTARPASQLHGAVAENSHVRAGTPEGSCHDRHIRNAIPDDPWAGWALGRLRNRRGRQGHPDLTMCGRSQRPTLAARVTSIFRFGVSLLADRPRSGRQGDPALATRLDRSVVGPGRGVNRGQGLGRLSSPPRGRRRQPWLPIGPGCLAHHAIARPAADADVHPRGRRCISQHETADSGSVRKVAAWSLPCAYQIGPPETSRNRAARSGALRPGRSTNPVSWTQDSLVFRSIGNNCSEFIINEMRACHMTLAFILPGSDSLGAGDEQYREEGGKQFPRREGLEDSYGNPRSCALRDCGENRGETQLSRINQFLLERCRPTTLDTICYRLARVVTIRPQR